MLEIQDEIRIIQGTLPELRRRRDVERQALDDVTGELERLSSDLEEKTARLRQVNRQCLVTEREIKENQNRIFFIRDQLSKIDEGVARIQVEFERREEELTRLLAEKEKTGEGVARTEKEIAAFSDREPLLEREKEELSRSLASMREERQAVSDAIAHALSETSLEREEVEARMQELNALFLARIQERSGVGERIAECEEAARTLQQEIADLEEERDRLERIRHLRMEHDARKSAVQELEEEYGRLRTRLTGLHETLEGRQEEFDSLVERSAALQQENRSLENEVAEYDEAVKNLGKAQEESDRASETISRDLEQVRRMFADRRGLEVVRLFTEEQLRTLEGRTRQTE